MLSDQMRLARKKAGYSMYALAKLTGVSVSSISEIEGGQNRNPGIITVAKLADVLSVSLDMLAERSSTPPPQRRRVARPAAGDSPERLP